MRLRAGWSQLFIESDNCAIQRHPGSSINRGPRRIRFSPEPATAAGFVNILRRIKSRPALVGSHAYSESRLFSLKTAQLQLYFARFTAAVRPG
jgi:hypothetical protein